MSSSVSLNPVSVQTSKDQNLGQASGNKSSAAMNIAQIKTTKSLQQAELQGQTVPISDEQLIKAIERAIKAMQGANTALEFSIHEKTKQIMVQVKNADTGEVIREIPPEKSLDFLAKVWEMAGILVDERR